MDLSTRYMGINLRNPLVVSASPLTRTIENIKKSEDYGAGAVVLRSLFEEQIELEIEASMENEDMYYWYPEAADLIKKISKDSKIRPYLHLLEQTAKEVSIPVIASVNCFRNGNWVPFAKKLENAGAQGLELNVSTHLPHDSQKNSMQLEEAIGEMVGKVCKEVKIPVAVKLGPYYTNLLHMADRLEKKGVKALVIFNRYYRPDIDIDTFEVISDKNLSVPGELTLPLRWIALLSRQVSCSLAASTGIHDYRGAIKQLLAGAHAVQICSVLYNQGMEYISVLLEDLENWMHEKGFTSLEDFRGKVADQKFYSAKFEQIQFIEKSMRSF